MNRTTFGLGVAALALVAHASASCGARSELEAPYGPQPPPPSDGGAPPDAPECAVFNSSAQLAPFDLFMMLDTSGSMSQITAQGTSKWESVQFALSSFFFDAESTGIGVQLDYFPIIDDVVPSYCDNNADCGMTAVLGCQPRRACEDGTRSCFADGDCDPGVSCVPMGRCRQQEPPNPNNQDFVICIPGSTIPGFQCSVGPCEPTGGCDDQFTCNSSAYLKLPPGNMLRLPADRDALVSDLESQPQPEGGTPTLPALRGVMDAALSWQQQNPETRIGVVLATDGFPSACDADLYTAPELTTSNLAQVAAEGFAGGIRTFVIGVFEADEGNIAEERLDPIATAGGSSKAFVVSTDDDVATSFREALNQIRVDAQACSFSVVDDEPIDFDAVWVKLQRGSEEIWVRQVPDEEACDPNDGGFYFDPPPAPNGTSATVVLCPTSCDVLGASANRRAEVFTECPDDPTQ